MLSDVIKSTATSSTPSLPKWFSNDLHILIPSLLQYVLLQSPYLYFRTNMTYYPSQSAVALLNKRFQPTAIPLDERKLEFGNPLTLELPPAALR